MSFSYTPLIFHKKPIWGPVFDTRVHSEEKQEPINYMTMSADQIRSKIADLQDILERRSEQFHEMNEIDDLLQESHFSRISYIKQLTSQRIKQQRQELRDQKRRLRQQRLEEKQKLREQKREEKRKRLEQKRLEREIEKIRFAQEQREQIRIQARIFRQMKRDQEEQARLKEIAEGWKTVTYKRVAKNPKKFVSKY